LRHVILVIAGRRAGAKRGPTTNSAKQSGSFFRALDRFAGFASSRRRWLNSMRADRRPKAASQGRNELRKNAKTARGAAPF
jgi:hypothetical protein